MLQILAKYLLEGVAIATVAGYLLGRGTSMRDLLLMTISIVLTLALLDTFAPGVAVGTRQGTGFSIGRQMIGAGSAATGLDLESELEPEPESNSWTAVSEAVGGNPGMLTSTPHSVNIMERFMDDKIAAHVQNQSGGGAMKCCRGNYGSLNERFISQIKRQRGGAPSAFEGFDSVPVVVTPTATSAVIPGMSTPMTQTNTNTATVMPVTVPLTTVIGSTAAATQPLFSGSLINLTDNNGNQLVSDSGTSVKLAKEGIGNGLFKLRFELVNGHDTLRQVAINYGTPVRLIYNDQNASPLPHVITVTGNAVSVSNSPTYSSGMTLMNSMNLQDTGSVTLGNDVVIQQSGLFLQVDPTTGRLNVVSSVTSASKFKIVSQRGCGPLWLFS